MTRLLCINGLFLLVSYNKFGMVYGTYLGVPGYNLKNVFFCLNTFFTFTNIADPEEMQHYSYYAAFVLGLRC